jgi:ParB-like chromosome segregation protein Spo0J
VAKAAYEQGLSVRATEDLARANTDEPSRAARTGRPAPGIADEAIDAFAGIFEAPVRVRSAAKGRVIVELVFDDEAAVSAAIDRLDTTRAPGTA